MPLPPEAAFRKSFDALPVTSDPGFQRLMTGGRLRVTGIHGAPDYVDEISARLALSSLRARHPTLLVLPDEAPHRPALLFAALLVMDALTRIEEGAPGARVLLVSDHTSIKGELANLKVGSLALDTVFPQHFAKGDGAPAPVVKPRSGAETDPAGGIHLPTVLSIVSPADPVGLLASSRPRWIAVDCASSDDPPWLGSLLTQATLMGVPVVGWTARHFGEATAVWLANGGGLFRWPRLVPASDPLVHSYSELATRRACTDVTARVLAGGQVPEVCQHLAAASESFLAASRYDLGRLASDTVLVGWRYLRALESLPVPLELYDREARAYWGTRRVSDLKLAFTRFVDANQTAPGGFRAAVNSAAEALDNACLLLRQDEPPLWRALANLCVDSNGKSAVVFSSRARKEMFSFALLAHFNISEDDLAAIGVRLTYLSLETRVGVKPNEPSRPAEPPEEEVVRVVVGLPSHYAERRLDRILCGGSVEIVLWPHQVPIFKSRLRSLSLALDFSCVALERVLPTLDATAVTPRPADPSSPDPVRFSGVKSIAVGSLNEQLSRSAQAVKLWNRPDAAEAIASLFATTPSPEDDEDVTAGPISSATDGEAAASILDRDSLWVQEALLIRFAEGWAVRVALDTQLNVITRKASAVEVEQRFVRSLRTGDEVLFIQGQKRQSLYDLLLSRVHRDPVIAQYIALVDRWHEDLSKAFVEAQARESMPPELLLTRIRIKGSAITSLQTISSWLRGFVLAPLDPEDLLRVAEVLSMGFVRTYYRQIDKAARRLRGLHISLSARLNRWLTSSDAGAVTTGATSEVVDMELGLTVEDFRHSLLRLTVQDLTHEQGPFYRLDLGRLERNLP